MKPFIFYLFLVSSIGLFAQQKPKVVCGEIVRIEKFPSKLIDPRTIDIWLPEGYTSKHKYSVLYMHDGQMLFDSSTSWNKQAWDIDDVACRLLEQKKVNDFIIVSIWNNGLKRHQEYFPQKPFESLSEAEKDSINGQLRKEGIVKDLFQPNSDNYLKFIVTELKPCIDKNYAVLPDKLHTFMAGSSMGGLISIYGICEYPDIFGGVACLSTHWFGTFDPNNPFPQAFINYLYRHLPNPNNHRIYFDHGDQTLDVLYAPFQKKADRAMIARGYNKTNWESLEFTGKDHSENSWKERIGIPLTFLLRK